MNSNWKVKAPGDYKVHTHNCLRWLGAQKPPARICLLEGLTAAQARTAHARARELRESIRRYPGWNFNIRVMVQEDQLVFERLKRGDGTWELMAVRRFTPTPITQTLENVPK